MVEGLRERAALARSQTQRVVPVFCYHDRSLKDGYDPCFGRLWAPVTPFLIYHVSELKVCTCLFFTPASVIYMLNGAL